MDYQKIYDNLIAKCKARTGFDGYSETHHIVPKSLGGHKTDPSNLVVLTAREHFIAHFLLAKMHGGTQWLSIKRMRGNDGFYINSRLYEIARRQIAKETSKRFSGKPKTEEQRAKMSASAIGKKKLPESIEKTRQANIGRKPNEAQLAALAMGRIRPEDYVSPLKGVSRSTPWMLGRTPANAGMPVSAETRAKLSAKKKGGKQTPEQIAKRVVARRATLQAQGRTV